MSRPDPRPARRVRDPGLMRGLHRLWRECALCEERHGPLSLHHIHKHPRDDLMANLVLLCGSGTTGCHGKVEAADRETCQQLGYRILERADTMAYLELKLGGETQARAFVERYYYASE